MSPRIDLDDIRVYCSYINHQFPGPLPIRTRLAETMQPMTVNMRINTAKVIESTSLDDIIKTGLLMGLNAEEQIARKAIMGAKITNIGVMNELYPKRGKILEVVLTFTNYTDVQNVFDELKLNKPTSFHVNTKGHSFTYTQNFSDGSSLQLTENDKRFSELVNNNNKRNKGYFNRFFN